MNLKLQTKLEKLLALAERGVGGEKETAQRMLEKLLAKNGLTIDDLTETATECYWFKWGGSLEKKLLGQINFMVGGDGSFYTQKNRRSQMGFDLTPSQYIDMELHYTAHKAGLAEQVDTVYLAYIHKHRIFSPSKSGGDEPDQEYSNDELARLRRMSAMMMMMPSVDARQQITDQST